MVRHFNFTFPSFHGLCQEHLRQLTLLEHTHEKITSLTIKLYYYLIIIIITHLMSGPKGKSYLCFPESPDVSRDDVEGNFRTQEKTKLTGFPRDLTLSVLIYFQTFTSTATKEQGFWQSAGKNGKQCGIFCQIVREIVRKKAKQCGKMLNSAGILRGVFFPFFGFSSISFTLR